MSIFEFPTPFLSEIHPWTPLSPCVIRGGSVKAEKLKFGKSSKWKIRDPLQSFLLLDAGWKTGQLHVLESEVGMDIPPILSKAEFDHCVECGYPVVSNDGVIGWVNSQENTLEVVDAKGSLPPYFYGFTPAADGERLWGMRSSKYFYHLRNTTGGKNGLESGPVLSQGSPVVWTGGEALRWRVVAPAERAFLLFRDERGNCPDIQLPYKRGKHVSCFISPESSQAIVYWVGPNQQKLCLLDLLKGEILATWDSEKMMLSDYVGLEGWFGPIAEDRFWASWRMGSTDTTDRILFQREDSELIARTEAIQSMRLPIFSGSGRGFGVLRGGYDLDGEYVLLVNGDLFCFKSGERVLNIWENCDIEVKVLLLPRDSKGRTRCF
jgi:hypothetical protein